MAQFLALDHFDLDNCMQKKILKAAIGVVAVLGLLAIGGGVWAYTHGYYHAMRGGIAQDNKDLDKAIFYFKIAYEKNPQAFMVAHDIACCYALKGDNESCFQWLRLALKSHYGVYAKKYAKTEPDFDAVRQTAEFQSLIYDSPPQQP
jgi:tetratricopeptide (TPR) repeat protein